MNQISSKFNLHLRMRSFASSIQGDGGYTIAETIVVLGIISILTATLVVSGGSSIKNERFTGNVSRFVSSLREAQVDSYTVQSVDCVFIVPGAECYWRGTVLDFEVSTPIYQQYLLVGLDLSRLTNSIYSQQGGLTLKTNLQNQQLDGIGIDLEAICLNDRTCTAAGVSSLSLAFLAPDGVGYSNAPAVTSANLDPSIKYYSGTDEITFKLGDQASNLTGYVTINPGTASIETRIE